MTNCQALLQSRAIQPFWYGDKRNSQYVPGSGITHGSRRTSRILGKVQALRPWPPSAVPHNPPCAGRMCNVSLEGCGRTIILLFKWYLWSTYRSTAAESTYCPVFGAYEDGSQCLGRGLYNTWLTRRGPGWELDLLVIKYGERAARAGKSTEGKPHQPPP